MVVGCGASEAEEFPVMKMNVWQMNVRIRGRHGQPWLKYLTEYKRIRLMRHGQVNGYIVAIGPFMLSSL
jgi:hypothetical protein